MDEKSIKRSHLSVLELKNSENGREFLAKLVTKTMLIVLITCNMFIAKPSVGGCWLAR